MGATPAAETTAHRTLDDRIEIGLQQAKELPVEELGDPTGRTKRPDIVECCTPRAATESPNCCHSAMPAWP